MPLTRKRALPWLVVALLVGAAARFYGIFDLSPPGLSHDEVAHWLIVQRILGGEHSVYFPDAYGHEALFHYVQALFVSLLGGHALALRLPAAFSGLLGVAAAYALNRRLFGRRVALIAAALLATLFWSVFYSRQGLRAISLPLLSGASAYVWWRAWGRSDVEPPASSARDFSLAGFLAGLSLYTYTAARAVPIFYAAFSFYLLAFHRKAFRQRRRNIVFFWLMVGLASLPLLAYLQQHPAAQVRVEEVNEPLRALLTGNIRPVVDNFVDILAGFGFGGDPLWRQNVPFRPAFHPLLALFFYSCLLYSLWRVTDARYAFLLLWIFTALIPSLVTIDAPSSIRMINILPVLTSLPAIVMHSWGKLSTEIGRLSTTALGVWFIPGVFFAIVLFQTFHTAEDILLTWPGDVNEVEFVWQTALRDAAAYLDSEEVGAVAIGGWSPETVDSPTMALYLRREDLTLHHYHPSSALIIPAAASAQQPARIIQPEILPLHPVLVERLAAWGIEPSAHGRFVEYQIDEPPGPDPQFPASVGFGNELLFLGHSLQPGCQSGSGQLCQAITFWRVLTPPKEPRRIFFHALDREGQVLAAGDDLGAPAAYWQPGDLLLQRHELAITGDAYAGLQTGVYNPETGARLLTPEGADFQLLAAEPPAAAETP